MSYRNWEINVSIDYRFEPDDVYVLCGLRRAHSDRALLLRRSVPKNTYYFTETTRNIFTSHSDTRTSHDFLCDKAKEELQKDAMAIVDFIEGMIEKYEQGAIDEYLRRKLDNITFIKEEIIEDKPKRETHTRRARNERREDHRTQPRQK